MKKNILLFFLGFIIMISCKSKVIERNVTIDEREEINYIPYYLKVYEADSLFVVKNYIGAFNILDSLYKKKMLKCEYGVYEYNTYLATCLLTGNKEKLDKKLKFGILNFGNLLIKHPLGGKLADSILKISNVSKDEYKQLQKQYYNSLNHELVKELSLILEEDQKVRTAEYSLEGMEFYRKKHFKKLQDIFKKYGYPSENKIGSQGYCDENEIKSLDVSALLMHQTDNDTSAVYVLNQLKSYLKDGSCPPMTYASVWDKYTWIKEEKQLYGRLVNYENNRFVLGLPIKYDNLDSIRKTIGLPRFDYDYWREKTLYQE